MKDYYSILGIKENAEAAEIKRAYRSLAVKYHPDRNPSPGAVAIFTQVNEAYDTLSDPKKKFVYDHQRYRHLHPPIQAEPVRQHKDPKYRPQAIRDKRTPRKSKHQLLIEKSYQCARWVNIVGLILAALFFLDYFIPYSIADETITEVVAAKNAGRRGQMLYHYRVYTESGRDIKVYIPIGQPGEKITLTTTQIYRIPMLVQSTSESVEIKIGDMYRHLIVFPVLLLLIAGLGVLARNNAYMTFNYSVGTVLLLVILKVIIF